jgi:hypothetical protein
VAWLKARLLVVDLGVGAIDLEGERDMDLLDGSEKRVSWGMVVLIARCARRDTRYVQCLVANSMRL